MRHFLKTKGLKMTSQREVIFRLFFESAGLVTVEELHEKCRAVDPSVGSSTVWRTLKLICDIGLGEKKYFGDGIVRYDKVSASPHGHVVCSDCGFTEEFFSPEMNRILQDRADEAGVAPAEFHIEVVGRCLACRQKPKTGTVVDIRRAQGA